MTQQLYARPYGRAARDLRRQPAPAGAARLAAAALLALALSACSRPAVSPEAYYRFARERAVSGTPRKAEVFRRDYAAAAAAAAAGGYGRRAADLRGLLLKELNIEFLLEEPRAGAPRVLSAVRREGYEERELLFEGSPVGAFRALLLLPAGAGAGLPAVVGLHGHGSSPGEFRDRYFGADLARAGFAVLLPEFRASGYDAAEQAVSRKLYEAGFTLLGLRVYETLLWTAYLKDSGLAAPGRIGAMGHSLGSGVALLAARLGADIAAVALDNALPLLDAGGGLEMHCETLPALSYYSVQIRDVSTLRQPHRLFSYDYPGAGDGETLTAFFRRALSGGLRHAAAPAAGAGESYRPGAEYLRLEKQAVARLQAELKQQAALRARAGALGRAYGLAPGGGAAERQDAR